MGFGGHILCRRVLCASHVVRYVLKTGGICNTLGPRPCSSPAGGITSYARVDQPR